jgi:hypothetical protein
MLICIKKLSGLYAIKIVKNSHQYSMHLDNYLSDQLMCMDKCSPFPCLPQPYLKTAHHKLQNSMQQLGNMSVTFKCIKQRD